MLEETAEWQKPSGVNMRSSTTLLQPVRLPEAPLARWTVKLLIGTMQLDNSPYSIESYQSL